MSSTLRNTIEKIKTLEAEKKNLLAEIESLNKIVEAKALALKLKLALCEPKLNR
jgi:uncharacterized protein (UPF0335 family)